MKPTFVLKDLTENIDESVVDLFHNFPKTEFGINYPEAEMSAEILKKHIKNEINKHFYIKKFVFYYENVPVGFAVFESQNFDKTFGCNVVSICFCIRESYRGFGLGNLVLSKLISKAFDMKFPALKCTIQNDNEIAKKVLHINNFKKSDEQSSDNREIYFLKLKS